MVKMYSAFFTGVMSIIVSIFCQKVFTFKVWTFTIYTFTTANHALKSTHKYKNCFIHICKYVKV